MIRIRHAVAALLALAISGGALADREEEEHAIEEVVVTGVMRVTAGGAQDANFVRSQIARAKIPHPNDLTAEGLLSEYDLQLQGDRPCSQLFCLSYEAMQSDLVSKPSDSLFIGLGFSTNVQEAGWQRAPINIVAVVDKSGSMDGAPLARVRKALAALAKAMKPGDQLSIVLYGDRSHVYLSPTSIGDRVLPEVLRSIQQIESHGSTNTEEGLQVGLQVAYETQPKFKGTTRLMLFTDERPNVGNTEPGGFIGLAEAASKRGIGMTTIGVGVQFDAELATKISSARGGNLFFLDSDDAANRLFGEELDYMISELAHDLKFVLQAHADYQLSGVYGVPQAMLSWEGPNAVSFTVPTVFFSKRGGGVFVTLARSEALANLPVSASDQNGARLSVAISYIDANEGLPGSDAIAVSKVSSNPSRSMQLASVLVDEYVSLIKATTAHHVRNDQETAYQAVRQLHGRLSESSPRWLRKQLSREIETTDILLDSFAFLSGHSSESTRHAFKDLLGIWRVVSTKGEDWLDIEKGSLWALGPSWILATDETVLGELNWSDREECTYTASLLAFDDGGLVARHRIRRGRLNLDFEEGGFQVRLERVADLPAELEELGE